MFGFETKTLTQPSVHVCTHPVIRFIFLFSVALGLGACFEIGGGGGSHGRSGNPSTAANAVVIAPGDLDCPYGGTLVETGIDENANGVLDASEVDNSEKVCNGAPGPQGEPGTDAPDRTVALCDLYHLTGETLSEFCPPPPSRFVDNGDGTITDTQTRLMWEKKREFPGSDPLVEDNWVGYAYAWKCVGIDPRPSACDVTEDRTVSGFLARMNLDSQDTIAGIGGWIYAIGGYTDWRLPTVTELSTILLLDEGTVVGNDSPCSESPCIDPVFGPTQAACYWTSTPSLRLGDFVRIGLDFSNGNGCLLSPYSSGYAYARAVRRID